MLANFDIEVISNLIKKELSSDKIFEWFYLLIKDSYKDNIHGLYVNRFEIYSLYKDYLEDKDRKNKTNAQYTEELIFLINKKSEKV